MHTLSTPRTIVLAAVALGSLSNTARAQVHFSIDYHGMTIAKPATGIGVPITEGDILAPATPGGLPAYGPLPPPTIVISGGFGPPGPGLGIPTHPGCIGHPAGAPCTVELDALSYGVDYAVARRPLPAGTYVFSVDECSFGAPGSPLPGNVTSESPFADAAADVFQDLGLPPGPLPPGGPVGNSGIVDGDGLASGSGWVYPGTGLVEPTPIAIGATGDDVDAIDFDTGFPPPGAGVFFSLDAGFLNPCLGIPNTGSAMANGFLPGAILLTAAPGGPPAIWAPPGMLGLDFFGAGTDDLDALSIAENGIAGFQPSAFSYDWTLAGPPDMVLYSVRRGSAVIGMPDSNFGIPIEAGDILTTPKAGGVSPFPAIFVAAEWLGLSTARMGGPMDDLDALDTRVLAQTSVPFCFGTPAKCPCGNVGAPGHGCANSGFAAGALLTATGTASVAADTVKLLGSGVPAGKLGLYFQGTTRKGGGFGVTFNDGVLCVGGPGIVRLGTHVADATGASFYPDPGLGQLPVSVRGAIPAAGGTYHYQLWHRDPAPAFCPPATSNYSNGVTLVWTP